MKPVLAIEPRNDNTYYIFFCPGCGRIHAIDKSWTIIGPMDKPTIHPSVFVNSPSSEFYVPRDFTCHSFIVDGLIKYLPDCTHELAGKTVPMEPIEEHYLGGKDCVE